MYFQNLAVDRVYFQNFGILRNSSNFAMLKPFVYTLRWQSEVLSFFSDSRIESHMSGNDYTIVFIHSALNTLLHIFPYGCNLKLLCFCCCCENWSEAVELNIVNETLDILDETTRFSVINDKRL